MEPLATTKVCPQCAETIQAAAKVCPHCRAWQQQRWSLQNPQVMAAVAAGFWILVFGGLGLFLERLLLPRRDFAPHQSELRIVESHLSLRVSGSNLLVTVVGTLTNLTAFGWKDVGLEAQCFNAAGELVDVVARGGDFSGVTLLPRTSAGFRLEGKAARPTNDYVRHEVFVRSAKDLRAWP